MSDQPRATTQNLGQATQELFGMRLLDIADWIGLGLAAAWFWVLFGRPHRTNYAGA